MNALTEILFNRECLLLSHISIDTCSFLLSETTQKLNRQEIALYIFIHDAAVWIYFNQQTLTF
jgi:hypothetical protein